MDEDDLTRLREALAQAPDTSGSVTWNPNVGDELIGVVITRDTVASKFSETPRVHLAIEDVAGDTWQVYANHAVLVKLIEKHNPQPGDQIAIQRLPDVPGKKYRVYKLVVVSNPDIPF